MNWVPIYALILLGITLVTYLFSICFECIGRRKWLLLLGGAFSLLPLLFFKYFNFINEQIFEILKIAGLRYELNGLNWAIPVGISFYTFQALGYLVDVYQQKATAERNISNYILFVSFFPQLISGPISKASELLPQIKTPRSFNYGQAKKGLQLLLWGMFLKLVVADRLGIYVDSVYENYTQINGLSCFVASVFYTFQIYSDFAGYSLMAIGIGKTLGFDLVNNFNRPYFSESITVFWRRWHISLTRWLTSYIYIPLGGSRCSKKRTYLNIMITFLVSGLWHGANWTFIVWGAMHGCFQIFEKMIGIDPKGKLNSNQFMRKIRFLRVVMTFLLISTAWIFFRMPTIDDAVNFIYMMLNSRGSDLFIGESSSNLVYCFIAMSVLIGKEILEEYFHFDINESSSFIRWPYYIVTTIMIFLFGVLDSGQFIYVSF